MLTSDQAVDQRWANRRLAWATPERSLFDPGRHEVRRIDELAAKRFVVAHHYSGTYPATIGRWGLFRDGHLAGVCTLGVPVQAKVLTGPFPWATPYSESVELSRLVLLDEVEFNAESWFVARVFDDARQLGVRAVVSFSDPIERRLADGTLLMPGHVGTVYQALNAVYAGRGTARTLTVLPDGTVFNARSAQKVRRQERGHGHVEPKLVAMGARPLSGDPASWLKRALSDVGAARVSHPGNHRYLFGLDRAARRRLPASEAYPRLEMAA